MKRETRVFDLSAELRAAGDGQPRHFRGHAAVYDRLSVELWGFYERIAPGTFQPALDGEDDVRFVINHDPSLLLARSKRGEGTLELFDDEVGFGAEADLPETSFARDLAVSMDRGDIDQMSFRFRTVDDDWAEETRKTDDGEVTILVRTLKKVRTEDVSVVTYPAYPDADASLRYVGAQPFGVDTVVQPPLDTTNADADARKLAELTPQFPDEVRELAEVLAEVREVGTDESNLERVLRARELFDELVAAASPAPAEDPSLSLDIHERRLRIAQRRVHVPAS
jgi:uncharacterized protein